MLGCCWVVVVVVAVVVVAVVVDDVDVDVVDGDGGAGDDHDFCRFDVANEWGDGDDLPPNPGAQR